MKILFVTDLYNIDNNNDSRALNDFVEIWQKIGHEVFVIRANFILNTLVRHKKISKEQVYNDSGVDVLNLNFITPFLGNIFNKLPSNINLNDFDVLISHMPSGALFSLRLLEKISVPYCISVHFSDIEVLSNPLYSFYFKNKLLDAYKRADVIAPRSLVLKNKIEKFVKHKKIFTASSGVEEKYISSESDLLLKSAKMKSNSKIIITTVSKLIKRKNINIVLEALSKIKDFDFEYRIIGSGEEIQSLKNLAKKLNLNTKVKFLGNIPHSEVFKYLSDSQIFVLLSEKETFGLVYLEAMACGDIVVGAKNEGIDGIIASGENGFLCDINSEKLSDLLIEVYNLPQEKINELLVNTRNTAIENTKSKASENYLKNIFN